MEAHICARSGGLPGAIGGPDMRKQQLEELKLCERAQTVDRRNQRFNQSTEAQKRVTIAKDVIKWLNLKKLIPMHGYVVVTDANNFEVYNAETVNGYTCKACGIGSLLACAVERGAADTLLTAKGYMPDQADTIWDKLDGLYDRVQLVLIEMAYEGNPHAYTEGGTPEAPCSALMSATADDPDPEAYEKLRDKCYTWRARIRNDEARMRAIMENIIANKGTFVP